MNNETKTNRIDKDLKIPYPGRPKTAKTRTAHQNNNREYITKNLSMSFESKEELEIFMNLPENVKRKSGHTRNDKLFMELLTEKDESLKVNKTIETEEN